MPALTIRNIDESLKENLRMLAAEHGRSMEEEVRQILRKSILFQKSSSGIGTRISGRFAKLGGIELPETSRSMPRGMADNAGEEPI